MIVRLGDVGTINTGNTPKTDNSENYSSCDICFIKPSDISDDEITHLSSSEFYISESARNKARILPKGSILVTCIGIIGKIAINHIECAFNQQINAIIPDPNKCITNYLAYALQYQKQKLQAMANAPVVPILNKSQFSNVEIKLQTLEQQQIIADTLDKVTYLISLRKKQLSKLDELVKSRFVEMFGGDNHQLVKASEVCEFITKGTTPPTEEITEDFNEGKVPFLKVYNLSFTGELLFDENPQYIPIDIHNKKLSRSKVYPNDVLMNIVGPPLGKFALVTNEFEEWNINQAIAIFRAKERVLPRFLLHALMQPEVLKPFVEQAVGIRQQNLSLEQCRNLQFPLPSFEEQQSFVRFAEQVDKSKFEIQKSLEKLETLKKSLMQKYFG